MHSTSWLDPHPCLNPACKIVSMNFECAGTWPKPAWSKPRSCIWPRCKSRATIWIGFLGWTPLSLSLWRLRWVWFSACWQLQFISLALRECLTTSICRKSFNIGMGPESNRFNRDQEYHNWIERWKSKAYDIRVLAFSKSVTYENSGGVAKYDAEWCWMLW